MINFEKITIVLYEKLYVWQLLWHIVKKFGPFLPHTANVQLYLTMQEWVHDTRLNEVASFYNTTLKSIRVQLTLRKIAVTI